MAFAYLVQGSEDGTIGIFRSKKRAIQAAKDYLASGGNEILYETSNDWVQSFYGEHSSASVNKWELD